MNKNNINRWLRPSILLALCILAGIGFLVPFAKEQLHPVMYIKSDTNLLEVKKAYLSEGEVDEDVFQIPRGAKVIVEEKGDTVSKINYNGEILSVPNDNLVKSRVDVVDSITTIYPRKLVNLRTERNGDLCQTVAQKGEALKVVSVLASDLNPETGEISWFEVEKDGELYYVAGTNMETTSENALKNYGSDVHYNPVYDSVYGSGYSQDAYVDQTDLKGQTKVSYADNPLLEDVQAVHITLENVVKYKDELIQLKNETGLNALVIALKGGNGFLWYDSEVPEKYFNNPESALQYSIMSKEELKSLIQELKNAGFYIIGRMETFADAALAFDRTDLAITDLEGNPVVYSDDFWTSAYSREVWEYNGDLSKEFAELGVNEVQYDFCRFPDGITSDEKNGYIQLHNTYDESKVAAIQGFLFYVAEELEPYHVYAAADIYGGPVMDLYDYDIGHFLPAIAAAADVVSPMIYLDTFSTSVYGDLDSETDARKILEYFSNDAISQLHGAENYGALRLWLQGYNNTSGPRIAQEIKGIMDAGLSGYMLWTDEGNIEDLEYLKEGYIESAK